MLRNAIQPQFVAEVIRSVARAYAWDKFIPTYTALETDAAILERVSGRYHTATDGFATVSHSGDRLYLQYNAWDREEIFRISDSTYTGRNDDRPIQFTVGKDGAVGMMAQLAPDGTVDQSATRMGADEHVPFELVLAGKPEEAVAAYRALRTASPEEEAVKEQVINDRGYRLLNAGKVVAARDLFYVNIALYPESSNVYDSYAEACLKNGEEELALVNYRKSFAMDPKNTNAERVIKELEAKKVGR